MASTPLRIGFIPLIDAALIAAYERGFFAAEGLAVSLQRQIGWANVRDKLTFGQLDVAHALLGMPLCSQFGRDSFSEPLIALMGLGSGGNAITVRLGLFEAGVKSAAELPVYYQAHRGAGLPVLGHVFGCSMHHYLLREWLSWGGVDPDREAKLCVIPPPQMLDHMRGGYLDFFCVGEPWNTITARAGVGVTLLFTTDILPRHPEKVLAVSSRFAARSGGVGSAIFVSLLRAVLHGCLWCAEMVVAGRHRELARMLAGKEYLALPAEVLEQSLAINRDIGAGPLQTKNRPRNWAARSFSPDMTGGTFPNKMHAVWMLREMIRWGHLHPEADVLDIARRSCDAAAYRTAATSLGVGCPEEDFAPMELRGGKMLTLEHIKAGRSLRPEATVDDARSRFPARVA